MSTVPDDYEVYVGVSRREDPAAAPCKLEDAYDKGKGAGKTRFRVVDIIVSGDNPINEYRVILTPH